MQSSINLNISQNRHCFLNGKISNQMLEFIQNVSMFNKCSIFISPKDSDNFEISIYGYIDQVSVTENKLKLFIDDSNPQNYSDFLELNSLSLLPLLAGNKSSVLRKISNQTNCKIYVPNLLPNIFFNNSLDNETGKPKIFITGLRSMVLLAKNLLQEILSKVSVNPFIKQINVMPIKREILTCTEYDCLNDLMYNTGCYLSLPALGSNETSTTGDLITFQGNSIEDVEILIDQFMDKLSILYCTKIEINLNSNFNDINKLLNLMDSLCSNSNSFVSLNKFDDKLVFQILGDSNNTKVAINYLNQNLVPFKSSCVQYQIELLNKEKDFISGKKNGKIIKIINMSNSTIKLLPLNENNFIVELKCNDLIDSTLGLSLLEDELPKMLTFNVPESFHRQIIGVGGQTIQAIMRRFNVFVKFSNSFELTDKSLDHDNILKSTNFQQSFIRKNNVVIKCPSKNKAQIPLAKIELEKLVEKVTKNNYSCCSIVMNNQQWKLMTSFEFNSLFNINRKKSTNFITELEKKTNTFIKYPDLDSIENSQSEIKLEIFGIENNSKFCSNELQKIIPYCYEFKLGNTNQLFNELKNLDKFNLTNIDLTPIQLSFLNNLIVPLRLLYNIELECFDNGVYQSLKLYYYPHSFGFDYIVNNANSDITTVERLPRESEIDIVQNTNFSQVIQGVNKFLMDWQFELLDSNIIQSEIKVNEIRLRLNNSNGSDEKLNLVNSNSNSRSNTNLNNSNNTGNNNNNTNNRSSKYKQKSQSLSRVASNLNSSEETLSSVATEKSKIFSSISIPSNKLQQQKQQQPSLSVSMPTQHVQTQISQFNPQQQQQQQQQSNNHQVHNNNNNIPSHYQNDIFHNGFLPSSLTNAMELNNFNFQNDLHFQSQTFNYTTRNNSNDKIWN